MSTKKKTRIFLLTLVCIFVLQNVLFPFNQNLEVAHAAAPKVEYLGAVSYSYYTVGKFKVNGEYAFCVDHAMSTPPTGSSYKNGSVYNNESIRAILYYGYEGDGNVIGNSNAALVATTIALDSVMHGNDSSGRSSVPGYDTLMKHAKDKDAPSTSASFSKTEASTSESGNLQKSETIKFNADSKNSIKLDIPSGVTLHLGGSTYTNRSVTVKGGQSFYLTAGLSYGNDVTFSNVKPSLGPYQAMLFVSSSGSTQRLGQGLEKDPKALKTLTVDFKVRQKKITVQHIDKQTNTVLTSASYTRDVGSSYKFSPESSITKGSSKYLPVDTKSKSGTLGSSDITLKFYYNLQRTITVNHIDKRDSRLIKTESHNVLRGYSYSYSPRTDLTKGIYKYQPLSTAKKTGTVGASNITLNFYYEIPEKTITVQHIDKYTNKVLSSESSTQFVGSSYSFSPKSSITQGENKYFPIDTKSQSGTLGNSNITIKFYYYLQRTIKINHIDARDSRLIATQSYQVMRGTSYSYGPRTDLKKGSYTYRPLSTAKKTGTVGASNITLNFYYDVPLIKVGLEKIQIYTAPSNQGLPVKVNLSKENIYPASTGDMNDAKLSVALYQGSTKVASNTYTAKSLPTSINFKVSPTYLAVNQKKAYTVKFEGYSKNEIDVISDAAKITTNGYTSSERALNVSSLSTSYTGVIMTEREVGKDMVVYNESLKVSLEKLKNKLTGYGFEYPVNVVYTNDLGKTLTSKFDLYVPKSLIDTYLTYPVKNNLSIISFDKTNDIETKNQTVLTTTQKFELPEVNIEKLTGNLFSNSQVAAKDSRIKYAIIDGGRKLYTPIWGDLGTFQLEMKNVDPLGINRVNISMKQNLSIDAYMYGHMDSTTEKQDALYLRPINSDDPKYPDNWTSADKKRFKQWNAK